MTTRPSRICFPTIATAILMASASAGVPDAVTDLSPAKPASEWRFRIGPYAWLTGLEGETGVGPLVASVDSSFSDIFSEINMAAALQIEARHGRWGVIADGFYADLGVSGTAPGPIYDSASVGVDQFIGELTVAYRIYESPRAFVDLYAGGRYNNLSLDFNATLDAAGIGGIASEASDRVVDRLTDRAESIAERRLDAYRAASAVRRARIESELRADIEAAADVRIRKDLKRELWRIRRDGRLNRRHLALREVSRSLKRELAELTAATARLEVARLRAEIDASMAGTVARAESRVDKARRDLADAIDRQVTSRVPTRASVEKEWIDPILGARAQWNMTDKWFLAGKSDIGGFGVGSDLTWSVQGTVGYQFTENVSAEIGWRYLDTDYQDGAFLYDVAEHGIFTGLNVRF